MAISNNNNANLSSINAINETALALKYQQMNNESISKNLFNGTSNKGPYTEVIKQMNQSIPMINSSSITVANKSATNGSVDEHLEPTLTISIMNGTNIAEKVTNDTVTVTNKSSDVTNKSSDVTIKSPDGMSVTIRLT